MTLWQWTRLIQNWQYRRLKMTAQEEYIKLEHDNGSGYANTLSCPNCGGSEFQLHCFGQPANIFTYCPCGSGYDVTELSRADKDIPEDDFWNADGSRKKTSPIGYGRIIPQADPDELK